MRNGKISAAVHDRCIRNQMRHAGMKADPGAVPGTSVRSIGGRLDPTPEMVLTEAVGRLGTGSISRDGYSVGITLQLLLAQNTQEEQLHAVMERILKFCASNGLDLLQADAAVGDTLTGDVLSVTAFRTDTGSEKGVLLPGSDLYMAGYTALAGTGIVSCAAKEQLSSRFPSVMVEKGISFLKEGSLLLPLPEGCLKVWPVQEGGILAALWDLGEYWNVGLDIDLRAVPVRQETIEICDHLQIHPYQLFTCGACLFTLPPGTGELPDIRTEGGYKIPVAQIGKVTAQKARILHSGEEVRYLDKPAQDSLYVLCSTNINDDLEMQERIGADKLL